MKYIYIILFFIVSCGQNTKDNRQSHIQENVYKNDKLTISKIFIDNVEYFRLYHLYNTDTEDYIKHYKKYPQAESDPANFYVPYGCRQVKSNKKFVSSPYPTDSQISVYVDTIIYNKKGNLFIAFVCIEKKYDIIDKFENRPHKYDCKAMIGYKEDTSSIIKIYPLTNFMAIGFNNRNTAIKVVKNDYMKNLKGSYLSGSIYGANKFLENVGDSTFFEKSQLFKKYNSKYYLFQMYKDIDGIKVFNYPYGN